MKSVIELELELSQAKLAKMTSTVKQLGTKLKDANFELQWALQEADFLRGKHREFLSLKKEMSKFVLTSEELEQRKKEAYAKSILPKNF
jgi:hypothetical protein